MPRSSPWTASAGRALLLFSLALAAVLAPQPAPATAGEAADAPSAERVAASLLTGTPSERLAAENEVQRHLGPAPEAVKFRTALAQALAGDIVRRDLLLDSWISDARSRDVPRREAAVRLLHAVGDAGIRRLIAWVHSPLLSNDALPRIEAPGERGVQDSPQGASRNRVGARKQLGHTPVVYQASDFAQFNLTPTQILAKLRDVPSASRIDQMGNVYLVFAPVAGHQKLQRYLEGEASSRQRGARSARRPAPQQSLPNEPRQGGAQNTRPPQPAEQRPAPPAPHQQIRPRVQRDGSFRAPEPTAGRIVPEATTQPSVARVAPQPVAVGPAHAPTPTHSSGTTRPHVEPDSAPDIFIVGDARGWRTTPVLIRVPRSPSLMRTLASWPGMPTGDESPARSSAPLVLPASPTVLAGWLERAPQLADAHTKPGAPLRIQGGNAARGFLGDVLPYRRTVEQAPTGSWRVEQDIERVGVTVTVRIAQPQTGPFAGRVCGRVEMRARDVARPLRTIKVRPDAQTAPIELDELEWRQETSVGLAPLSAAGGGMMLIVPDPGKPEGLLLLLVGFERGVTPPTRAPVESAPPANGDRAGGK